MVPAMRWALSFMLSKKFLAVAVTAGVLLVLAGTWMRRSARRVLTPDRLRYPCLRIYDGSIWERIDNEAELRSTPRNYDMNRKDDPLLIDSEFRVATMSKLKMKGSELGLLLTGPRPIEIEFDLEFRPEFSVSQARSLVDQLIQQAAPTPSHDLSDSIQSATSLAELIELLQRTRFQ